MKKRVASRQSLVTSKVESIVENRESSQIVASHCREALSLQGGSNDPVDRLTGGAQSLVYEKATKRSFICHFVNSLILFLTLAACGFQPLHGQAYREAQSVDLSALDVHVAGTAVASSNVATTTIPRRYGELLKAEIEDGSNPRGLSGAKRFTLDVNFTESDIALFVNPDGTASRGDLNYASTYSITRISDGKLVASGTLNRVSSYNSSPTADFASYVSIEDARKRGILELAQDYKLRLATLLPTLNRPDASAIEPKPEAPAPELQPVHSYETIRQGR